MEGDSNYMISKELRDLIEEFNKKGDMRYLEGVSREKISEFERKNSIELPDRYVEWLQYSDGGELFLPAGIQLYGIEHKPVIDIDDDYRPNDNYIVIGALASGDPILCEKKGNRVAIYNIEADRIEDDEIYDSFFDFLNDLIDLLGIEE